MKKAIERTKKNKLIYGVNINLKKINAHIDSAMPKAFQTRKKISIIAVTKNLTISAWSEALKNNLFL